MSDITHYEKAVNLVRYKVVLEVHDLVLRDLRQAQVELEAVQGYLLNLNRRNLPRPVATRVSKVQVALARLLEPVTGVLEDHEQD